MLFSFICIDKPGSAVLRSSLRAEHLSYMMGVKDRTIFGGPLQDDLGATSIGSIFVLDLGSRADAEAFIESEPYKRGGLFETVMIRRWRQMAPEPVEGFLQEELTRERAKLGQR